MSDELLELWGYFLERRCSVADTLEYDYPQLLASDDRLKQAVYNIRANEALILQVMNRKIKELP